METNQTSLEFDRYLAYLSQGLGHADRHAGLRGCCTGLMLSLPHPQGVVPVAARPGPLHASAGMQSLHHFVACSEWSDTAVMARVRDWVLPALRFDGGGCWWVGDTVVPKKGRHSVGVSRQNCGQPGRQNNCQVAVSLSLACAQGSLPMAYQLYLPQDWADDAARRKAAGVPEDVVYATRPALALAQIRQAVGSAVPQGVVLADAAYGSDAAFRAGITALGLPYAVGVGPDAAVWVPASEHARFAGGQSAAALCQELLQGPIAVKAIALGLKAQEWRTVSWRPQGGAELASRWAALRVHPVSRHGLGVPPWAQEWLLIDWPEGAAEPAQYIFATAAADATLQELARLVQMRWRTERDGQALQQDFGLGHYEGRGWRGFHHHATLRIAVYGFLLAQRLKAGCARGAAEPIGTPKQGGPGGLPAWHHATDSTIRT